MLLSRQTLPGNQVPCTVLFEHKAQASTAATAGSAPTGSDAEATRGQYDHEYEPTDAYPTTAGASTEPAAHEPAPRDAIPPAGYWNEANNPRTASRRTAGSAAGSSCCCSATGPTNECSADLWQG